MSPSLDRNEVRAMHAIVRNLHHEKLWVYWRDFGRDAAMGWGAFLLPLLFAMSRPLWAVCLLISIRGFYGMLSYLHEFAHGRGGRWLVRAWSVLFGAPFLVHCFMYLAIHKHHHSTRGYATEGDGEYITLVAERRSFLAKLILWNFLLPILGAIRFGLMVPAGVLSRRFRFYVYRNFSMVGMKFTLMRSGPADAAEAAAWQRQEFMSMTSCWLVAGGMVTGWLPPAFVAQWYIVMVGFATLNAIRGIAAHRYALRNDGAQVSLTAQLGDSLNVTGRSFSTWLLCPNGIQYHALHHVFPGIPYHALADAHQRLVSNLPANAAYHAANVPSVWASWKGLIGSMGPAIRPWPAEPTIKAS